MPKHHDQLDDQTVQPQIPLTHTEYDLDKARSGVFSELSAEQYLSYVRDQARKLPTILKAENLDLSQYAGRQTKYMPDISSIHACANEYLPSREWEQEVIESFQRLRDIIQSIKSSTENIPRNIVVPAMKDERSWFTICSGRNEEYIEDNGSDCTGDTNDSNEDDSSDEDANVERYLENYRNNSEEKKNDDQMSHEHVKFVEPVDQGEFLKEDATKLLLEQKRVELEEAIRLKRETEQMYKDIEDESKRLVAESRSAEEIDVLLLKKFGDDAMAAYAASSESKAILLSKFFQSPSVFWTEPMKPSLPLILQFDQVLVQKLLHYNVTWVEASNSISTSRSQWIYALLAILEKPVYQDTVALLRQLYRRSCNIRSTLCTTENRDEGGDEKSLDKDIEITLAPVNLLIVLTGLYFGQGENYPSKN